MQGRLCDQWDEGLGPSYESVNLGTALFRRSVFGTVGLFNERLRRLEDYEWFLRAFDFRVPKTRTDCTALNYLRRTDGLTGSAPTPDPLFVRVHRGAAARRRAGLAPAPPGFPTPQEYFGVAPSEAERRPRQPTPFSCTPSATTVSTALTRIDTRTIDDGPGVRAFLCVRNEGMRLRALLDHHRKLGVVSFFIIDNESTDGSTTWMMEEPDVYVWRTTGSFQEAQFGTRWMLSLIDAFGRDRWCLVVDADELLIVPKGDRETLDDYCEALDREDANAVLAVMVDMYPYGELRNAQYRSGENPLHLCRWFDRNVWTTKMPKFFGHENHESFFGGVRERVFGSPSRHETHTNSPVYYTLNKVPLFKFTTGQRFSPSFHWVDGARMSTSRCALLHWKFTANLSEKVVSEVQREEHWDGASQYKRYANALIDDGGLSLFDPVDLGRVPRS